MNKMVSRLLRKNLSKAQIVGFTLSNLVGLAIVVTGLQLYLDVRPIWEDEDSFLQKDYLVVNKQVNSVQYGENAAYFTDADIADLERQPWVRGVGKFSSATFKVNATMSGPGQRGLSTYMFFESIPNGYIDVPDAQWGYHEGDAEVPIIISKDYLALYNFGFATSAGLPQVSENVMGSLPVHLSLRSEDGLRTATLDGRIVGFSNRLNTILVPQEFMDWANDTYGTGAAVAPKRLIIDVSSPGDTSINQYVAEHDWEIAGDKSGSQASFFINVVTGAIIGVGLLVTLLSFFILFLSISLLMQKNKEKLHSLIMLGYPLKVIGGPYRYLVVIVSAVAYFLAAILMVIIRQAYIHSVEGMGGGSGIAGVCVALGVGAVLAVATALFNVLAVDRRVKESFYK
jgi:hypothetical protein